MEFRTFLRSSFPTEILSEIFSNLDYSDLSQVCSQVEYRDIFDDVFWKNKAQKDFGVSTQTFDFYKGYRDGGFCRPISASYRYLELLSIFRLTPQLLVRFNPPVLSGFYIPTKFLMQAIKRNDQKSISLMSNFIESLRTDLTVEYSSLSNEEKAKILHSTLEFVQSHCKSKIHFPERPILTKQDNLVLREKFAELKEIREKEKLNNSIQWLFGSPNKQIESFAFDLWKENLMGDISPTGIMPIGSEYWIESTLVFAARNPHSNNFFRMIDYISKNVPKFNLKSESFSRRLIYAAFFSCNFEIVQLFSSKVSSQWVAREIMQGSRSFPGRSQQIISFLSKTFFSPFPQRFFLEESDVEETIKFLKQIDDIDVFQYVLERQFICRPTSLIEVDPSISQDASRLWLTLSFSQAVLKGEDYTKFQQSVRKIFGDESDPTLRSIVNFFFSESFPRL
ncbi:hypothetical protein pv_69 [Pithovirus sibericum]|uniref:F-box domain-containing protein n=1 Tax=Pithovirus sibericum TaxID=1450746 RepID=W5S4K7_9VIRU|nr:hypothetical protein pv_69 [Pithovirus sibericum]AHH01636.1 hypothetical protein pv_69 [Pithovirus sibericum]